MQVWQLSDRLHLPSTQKQWQMKVYKDFLLGVFCGGPGGDEPASWQEKVPLSYVGSKLPVFSYGNGRDGHQP